MGLLCALADPPLPLLADLLFTEPIVAVFSAWVGFAWAFLFLTLEAVPLIFGNLYSFNSGEIGLVFFSLV